MFRNTLKFKKHQLYRIGSPETRQYALVKRAQGTLCTLAPQFAGPDRLDARGRSPAEPFMPGIGLV
jgi:hypothetical protein